MLLSYFTILIISSLIQLIPLYLRTNNLISFVYILFY